MVLSHQLTRAVADRDLVLETVHTWLQHLPRPEDINDVDDERMTVLILCINYGAERTDEDDTVGRTNYLTAIRWLLSRGADV